MKLGIFENISIPITILIIILLTSLLIHEGASQASLSNSAPYQQLVTYQKKSDFIHEFNVPDIQEKGLKGIVTDSYGNPWSYYQTNKTSAIIKFNLLNKTFINYEIEGNTVSNTSIINLAGGQLIYDEKRNSIWFTDARLNALGSINADSGRISLHEIPTNNSGVMGLVLSPDNNSIWFAEIIGNKIGSFDIDSKTMSEYPTGDLTGPTLLTFDSVGRLWITMSYSSNILMAELGLLIPGSRTNGMFEFSLEKPDSISPFGIAITNHNSNKLFISDHGSSRVIVSNLSSELRNYTSYWTSPSAAYPMSLPSQVTPDNEGNVYFAEHGGNKISKISKDGILTEFEIPTGPLATVVFLSVSSDASKIWFTEWASNRIGYLDNTLRVPLDLKITSTLPSSLKSDEPYSLDITATRNENVTNAPLLLNEVQLSLIGMTESGLQELTYLANPRIFDLTNVTNMNGTLNLTVGKYASAGKYTVMPRISTSGKDNVTVSLSYPQTIELNVPANKVQAQTLSAKSIQDSSDTTLFLKESIKYGSLAVAMSLIGYIVYRKIRQHKTR